MPPSQISQGKSQNKSLLHAGEEATIERRAKLTKERSEDEIITEEGNKLYTGLKKKIARLGADNNVSHRPNQGVAERRFIGGRSILQKILKK